MNDSTSITKGRDGWEAKTYIPMGLIEDGDALAGRGERRLSITTSKASRGGISTYASVATHSDGVMRFIVFGDYSKQVAKLDARCTEKSIRELHQTVLNQQASAILAEATAFYYAKDEEAARTEDRKHDRMRADEEAQALGFKDAAECDEHQRWAEGAGKEAEQHIRAVLGSVS